MWQKIKLMLASFMQGRHGADNFSMFTLITGLALTILSSILGNGLLSFLGFALYIYTIFRMFSRNNEARARENRKYIDLTSNWKKKINQFVRRLKNSREYKYFKCPKCKAILRLKRGSGEKDITCPRCSNQFHQKS